MPRVFNYRANGSLMLLGEHAVLHQGWGVCCAIEQFIDVQMQLRDDRIVTIQSDLGSYEGSLDALVVHEPLRYAIGAIKTCLEHYPYGFDIIYSSTIDTKLGFGSSAATVVATLGALNQAFFHSVDEDRLLRQSIATVQAVQGLGSGCDCAASVYGTTIAFNPRTVELIKFPHALELTILYCGYKVQTKKMVDFVSQRLAADPKKVTQIFDAIEDLTASGMRALTNNDLSQLGEMMTSHHHQLKELGVSNQDLETLVGLLGQHHAILGAKISGAGGGDCVIGLGSAHIHLPIDMPRSRIIHTRTLTRNN